MRYVPLEGKHKVALVYHFCLLNHFRFSDFEKVNFHFFILHLMEILIKNFNKEIDIPLHKSIVNLVYDKTLDKRPKGNPKV